MLSQGHLDEALERLSSAHADELHKLRESQAASLEEAVAAAHVDAAKSVATEWEAKEQSIKQELEVLLQKSTSESAEKDALIQTIKTDLEVRLLSRLESPG